MDPSIVAEAIRRRLQPQPAVQRQGNQVNLGPSASPDLDKEALRRVLMNIK